MNILSLPQRPLPSRNAGMSLSMSQLIFSFMYHLFSCKFKEKTQNSEHYRLPLLSCRHPSRMVPFQSPLLLAIHLQGPNPSPRALVRAASGAIEPTGLVSTAPNSSIHAAYNAREWPVNWID
jgi:hypothetical protein